MKPVPETKLARAGNWSGRHTVGDGSVDDVGERAHIRVARRAVHRASVGGPRYNAREVRSAPRYARHRAAAVALTRASVVRRACAQHRRVQIEITARLERAVACAVCHNAHRRVQQHAG